jgi:hypothetical protein
LALAHQLWNGLAGQVVRTVRLSGLDRSRFRDYSAQAAQVNATRALIARHCPQDRADLETMVRLGKLEHQC